MPTIAITRVHHSPGNDVVRIEATYDGEPLQVNLHYPDVQRLNVAQRRAAVAAAIAAAADRAGLIDDLGLTGTVITIPSPSPNP
jgi:hypothetical protein